MELIKYLYNQMDRSQKLCMIPVVLFGSMNLVSLMFSIYSKDFLAILISLCGCAIVVWSTMPVFEWFYDEIKEYYSVSNQTEVEQ